MGKVDIEGLDTRETSDVAKHGFDTFHERHACITPSGRSRPGIDQEFRCTRLTRTVLITCKCFGSADSEKEYEAQYDISECFLHDSVIFKVKHFSDKLERIQVN